MLEQNKSFALRLVLLGRIVPKVVRVHAPAAPSSLEDVGGDEAVPEALPEHRLGQQLGAQPDAAEQLKGH